MRQLICSSQQLSRFADEEKEKVLTQGHRLDSNPGTV